MIFTFVGIVECYLKAGFYIVHIVERITIEKGIALGAKKGGINEKIYLRYMQERV
jgi:hypothetical protein